MYRKKILSMAAAAAIVTTGAIAFDTNQDGELLLSTTEARGFYDYTTAGPVNENYQIVVDNNDANKATTKRTEKQSTASFPIQTIKNLGPGEIGDTLIYPAFFGGSIDENGNQSAWNSEFSVINTTNHAIIAKVVLYGSIDSVELRDFNIYLSAHDVFRAKLANGKIYSEDGSTVLPGTDRTEKIETADVYSRDTTKSIYKYNDDCEMASKDKPFEISIDPAEETGEIGHGKDANGDPVYEHNGYIAVFAMAEAVGETYHGKHKELWQDYRHLIDTCRSKNDISGNRVADIEWRDGLTVGLYNDVNLTTPNRIADSDDDIYYIDNCQYVYPSVLGEIEPKDKRKRVEFQSPRRALTGSIVVSNPGTDAKTHRDLLIKAYALDNVTDDRSNQLLLWSEGEFAHLADRCIDRESLIEKDEDGNKTIKYFAGYSLPCIQADANKLHVNRTYYEFRDNAENRLVVTQPYKRVLLQRLKVKNGRIMAWNNLTLNDREVNGEFKLDMEIYNDDEEHFTPTIGAFTVSPATSSRTAGIPNEVSVFNPFKAISDRDQARLETEQYKQGYSVIKYRNGSYTGIPAIVSQMSATENDGIIETNWLYPLSE
jgi:hypothetical protein